MTTTTTTTREIANRQNGNHFTGKKTETNGHFIPSLHSLLPLPHRYGSEHEKVAEWRP